MEKNDPCPYFTSYINYTKINPTKIVSKTIRILEDDMRELLHDPG